MLRNIRLTLGQLTDPSFRRVLLMSLGATFVLLAAFLGAGFWATGLIPQFGWQWVNVAIGWLLGLGLVFGSVFLIVPVAGIFVGLMLDTVAEAVEAKHYPDGPAGRSQPFWPSLATGLRFAAVLLGVNLLALIFYVALPGLNLVIFLTINGYLVGREYFELAGHRYLPAAEVTRVRRRHRGKVVAVGVVITGLMVLPVINLIAPLFGTALMVHEFRRIAARDLKPDG